MHYSFYIFLFFAIWFTIVNGIRGLRNQTVSIPNLVIMAAAIVGCVYSAVELSHNHS